MYVHEYVRQFRDEVPIDEEGPPTGQYSPRPDAEGEYVVDAEEDICRDAEGSDQQTRENYHDNEIEEHVTDRETGRSGKMGRIRCEDLARRVIKIVI